MSTQKIDCEQAIKQIFEFIDHELSDGEHALLEQHLRTCKSCFSRMEFERMLKQKMGALADKVPSAALDARVRKLLAGF
jgi:anti-sigma factor (TIGR02949 family)